MKKNANKKSPIPRFFRKLLKISLWVICIIIVLFIAAIVFVRVQYPEDRVLALISETVEKNLGTPLTIEDISWRLPLRLSITGIALNYPAQGDEKETTFFHLNQFSISFRLLALLKRQLDIQSVLIDQPSVFLDTQKLKALAKTTSEDSSFKSKKPATSKQKKELLPFSLGLSRFRLQNFDCNILLQDSTIHREINLTGLNLNISNVHVPREISSSLEDVRGRIRLFTQQSTLTYSEDQYQNTYLPDLHLNLAWRKNQRWQAKGRIGVSSEADTSQNLQIQMDIQGWGKGDSIRVAPLSFSLRHLPVFSIHGNIAHLIEQPKLQATLESQILALSQIRPLAKTFLPPVLFETMEPLDIQGNAKLIEGTISGSLEDLHFNIKSSLQDGYATYLNQAVDSLYYNFNVQGQVKAKQDNPKEPVQLSESAVEGMVGFVSIKASINDSTRIRTGPFSLQLESALDSCGIPQKGRLIGNLKNLFQGQLGLDFQWGLKSGAPKAMEYVFIHGGVSLDSVAIQSFPGMSGTTEGRISANVDLNLPNLYQGVIKAGVQIPHLMYTLEKANDTLPPVRLVSDWAFQTEPAFQQVWLDSGRIWLNDLLSAHLTGQMDLKKQTYWMHLNRMVLDHKKIRSFLPASLLATMEGISLSGQTVLTAEVKGSANQPDSLSIQSVLMIQDGQFTHAQSNLAVHGLSARISADGTPNHLSGHGTIHLDTLALSAMRDDPVENTFLNFDWQWIADKSVNLSHTHLQNDQLGINVNVEGGLDHLADPFPAIHVSCDIELDEKDWVDAVQGFMVQGQGKIVFEAEQIYNSQRLKVSGNASMTHMNLRQADALALTDIQGHIPFRIEMDLEKACVISDPDYAPPTWIDYENRRSQFRSLKAGQSTLSVKEIDVAGYLLSSLAMDIEIRKGYILIPWFVVQTFNGNVGGSFHVYLGTGQPETVAYEIHAQAARINSAALGNLTIKKEEDAELDATMAFRGLGVDIEKDMDMNGYFYITKIGPQFTSLLLQGMDPKGEDRNIRLIQRLMKMGWRPKLFSFEMRHGYVYPSLTLSQPWFKFIFKLPETFSLGRLPLKFFMENPELAKQK